jgi:biopolymer transport protein TolR
VAFRIGDEEGLMADINVTPLVDVMLVLLIIFMITAPMLHRGIAVRLPESKTDNLRQSPESPLVLSLRSDRALFLGETPVARGVLEDRLRATLASRKDKTIFLKADRGLPYGFVVDILDALNRSGIDGIGMITTPGGSSQPPERRPN